MCRHHAGRTPLKQQAYVRLSCLHNIAESAGDGNDLLVWRCLLSSQLWRRSIHTMVSAARCEVCFQCGGNLPRIGSNCKCWRRKIAAVALQLLTHSARKVYSCLLCCRYWCHASVRVPMRVPNHPRLLVFISLSRCPSSHLSIRASVRPSVRPSVRQYDNTSAGLSIDIRSIELDLRNYCLFVRIMAIDLQINNISIDA